MLKLLRETLVVSLCYVTSYSIGAFYPAFMFFGGAFGAESASLLFLPHGVRVLTAWLYGYKSVLLLAPASFFTHALRLDGEDLALGFYLGPLFGVVCAAVTFDVCARLGFDVRLRDDYRANWRGVFVVGALSSVINSVGTNIAFGDDLKVMIAYWVGDVGGLFAALVILMFLFRALRKFANS